MTRRIVGKYWNYDGNSTSGKDHERRTPKGFDLDTVLMVAAIANDIEFMAHDGNFTKRVTEEEAQQIEIIHHNGDDFGHEVTVKAPRSVWEKATNASTQK
jgi:hypothetical protein